MLGKEYFYKAAFPQDGNREESPTTWQSFVSVSPLPEENESRCFWLLVGEWGNHFKAEFKAPQRQELSELEGLGSQRGWWHTLPVGPGCKARRRDSPAGRDLSAILLSISIPLPTCFPYSVNPHLVLSWEESSCHHPVCTRRKQTHVDHKAHLLVKR